jgi:hypothetical protein
MGLKACPDVMEKGKICLYRDSNPYSSVVQPIA